MVYCPARSPIKINGSIIVYLRYRFQFVGRNGCDCCRCFDGTATARCCRRAPVIAFECLSPCQASQCIFTIKLNILQNATKIRIFTMPEYFFFLSLPSLFLFFSWYNYVGLLVACVQPFLGSPNAGASSTTCGRQNKRR